jgi:hypothetical protein
MISKVDLDYETLRQEGTGSHTSTGTKTVEIAFDRYVVTLKLTSDNKFVAVEEVSLNQDFLSNMQQVHALSALGYHDVEQYYGDAPEDTEE